VVRSNATQVYAKLRNDIKNLKKLGSVSDSVTRTIIFTSLALMKKRIFEDGRTTSGSGIGTYSKDYYNKVRKANNWSNTKITLELTGEMRREFIPAPVNGNWAIGFLRANGDESYSFKKEFTGKRKSKNNPSGTKGIRRVTTTAPVSGDRAEVLEKRYGTIFHMSVDEVNEVTKAFEHEVKKRIGG
jgi:hypothetical protein